MLLTKNGLENIKKERDKIQMFLTEEATESAKRGGPMDSFKEAAAISASLQAYEKKLAELNEIIEKAEVLPDKVTGELIIIGKTFKVQDAIRTNTYTLVESAEANISLGKISKDSPLGKSVYEKKAGYRFELNGNSFLILEVN